MTELKAAVTLPVDVEEIQRLLPHRYPFLLVDRVIEIDPGKSITALSLMRLIPDPPGRIVGGSITVDGKDLLAFDEDAMRAHAIALQIGW